MRKRLKKREFYVFSVFSTVLGDYPYYPFVAKSVYQGIRKYMCFLDSRKSICDGAELHLIGTCEIFDKSGECSIENLQPYIIPQKVEIKNGFLMRMVILGTYYVDCLGRYLKTLKARYEYGKRERK